ncbi:hypothetical protein SPRG_06470 [Saprolegnia parasitica CBS 223.65]|uniref:Uncharacterized protein n=1 Tax=Saprolegnia parasitica (strain CBS 223.65) TaxID=695850 RepID=A0A067CCY3_SAPPC|nr:hypothetical protein SPRG_06470 [Saprolegnia parasitica CBS 223.65]KDO28614.1 hypothetical protein SPRG_06470 [Saprolegnia parasitica CBS 223.65]|eukprot:XP_012200677.1 hypothetical protein SPRG_06470 [Saprolegnia parasitica CBS 223.65]
MASLFHRVVLGQPEIASLVFEFQAGLYEDVRPAFLAFHRLVELRSEHFEPEYRSDVSFRHVFAPGAKWASSWSRSFRADAYMLDKLARDARFPLHVAIYEGLDHLAKRMLACRPDLASEDAILLAFMVNRLEMAEFLLDLRSVVPELHRRVNTLVPPPPPHLRQYQPTVLERLMGNESPEAMRLLLRFSPRPDMWTHQELSLATRRGRLDNIAFAIDHFEWFSYPDLVEDVAVLGALHLVRALLERGLFCSAEVLDTAACHGFLEMVEYLHVHSRGGCTTNAMDDAARCGHLDVVRFLHDHRHEGCTVEAMNKAAMYGEIATVEFLHRHRNEGCTVEAMDNAAMFGHLEVVQFLHVNRTEGCTTEALNWAVTNGHLDVVRFLIEHRTEGASPGILTEPLAAAPSTWSIDRAAELGREDILRFLLAHRREGGTRDNVVRLALQNRHVSIAKHLVLLGYPFPTPIPDQWDYDKATIEFFVAHGAPWSTEWMDRACLTGDLMLVKFLHAHSNAGCTTAALENAICSRAWNVVDFLLAHRREGVSARGFVQVLNSRYLGVMEALNSQHMKHLEVLGRLLQRQPELRDDAVVLDDLIHFGLPDALQFALAAGFAQPRAALMKCAGRPTFTSNCKLVLPYCMDTKDHVENILFLLDLVALPDRWRPTMLDLVSSELTYQMRMARHRVGRIDKLVAHEAALLARGDVVDAACAFTFGHLDSTRATAESARLATYASLVQDATLKETLSSLLSRKRKRTMPI